jgi:hypothetical protein
MKHFEYLLCLLAVSGHHLLGQTMVTAPVAISSTAAIILRRDGCVPDQTVIRPGNALIEVINRTGSKSITYHIRPASKGAASLVDGSANGKSARAPHILNLGPGSYQLTVDGSTRLQCSITVK